MTGLLLVPLLLVISIVGSSLLLDTHRHKKLDVFNPVYGVSALFFAFFVLRPYLLTKGLTDPYLSFDERVLPKAILYGGVVSPLFFFVGYHLPVGRVIGYKTPYPSADFSLRRLRAVIIACWLASITLCGLIAGKLIGGLRTAVISPITVQNTLLKQGGGYLSLALSLAQSLFWILLSLRLFRHKRVSKFVLLTSFSFALFFAYVSGLRGNILMLFGVGMGLWHYAKNKRIRPITGLAIFSLVMILIGVLNLLRHHGSVEWELALDSQFIFSQVANVLAPFDSFTYVLGGIDSGEIAPLYGTPYLMYLLAPIPRQIWPNKPVISVGVLFTQLLGYDFRDRTFTVTIPGELYWNLPVVGLVLGMILWGVALRSAYEYRESHNDSATTLLFLVIYLNALNAFRTSFLTWINSSVLLILPLILLYSVIGSWFKKKAPLVTTQVE